MKKFVALAFAAVLPSAAQTVPAKDLRYMRATPQVVNARSFQPLLLEAHVGAGVTRVDLVDNDATVAAVPFHDDGQQGDKVANDRIFSLVLPAAEVQKRYVGRAVYARDTILNIGLADVRNSTASLGRYGVTLPLLADNTFATPITRTANGQFTSLVYNYSVPYSQFLPDGFNDAAMAVHFYQEFNDSFDFLNLVSSGSLYENRHHVVVFNNVLGTGNPSINSRNSFGASTTLQGVNRFPIDWFYGSIAEDGVAYAHETGHQWMQYLRSIPALMPAVPHWPLGSLASGIMGFSIPPTGEGGSFRYNLLPVTGGYRAVTQTGPPRFLDMELYVMGLIPPEQVRPHFAFNNVDANTIFEQIGRSQVITNATTPVTVDQIIVAHGLRSPGPPTSQKIFRVATVLATPDDLASPDLMSWMHNETNWQNARFFTATGARAQTLMLIEDARKGRTQPAVYLQRVVNAASNAEGPVAPQEIVTLNGSGIGPDVLASFALTADLKLPVIVGGVRVLFDSEPAPMIYASKGQVSAIVPSSAGGKASTQVVVEFQGVRSNTLTIAVAGSRPGIFTAGSTGVGAGAILNQDYSLNTVDNFARLGSAALVYITGAGALNPPLADGALGTASNLVPGNVSATVQGVNARILYAGAAPGLVAGLVQINVEMPSATGTVERQLILTINGQTSQSHVIIHGSNTR